MASKYRSEKGEVCFGKWELEMMSADLITENSPRDFELGSIKADNVRLTPAMKGPRSRPANFATKYAAYQV